MLTQHQHRIIAIVPAARRAALNAFLGAALGPAWANTFTVPLNATGDPTDPVTHYWACWSCTSAEQDVWVDRLCQQAALSKPSWAGWTTQQILNWVAANLATIRTKTGVYLAYGSNVATWPDPQACLAAVGVQPLRPAI